jgi:enoyl-CoA hydratase/carnithine racemase
MMEVSATGVALLTLNRPEARNALNRELLERLSSELRQISEDASLRAVVLHGEGQGFSAGADLKERAGLSVDERSEHTARVRSVADQLAAVPVPVVAAVHGFAVAGGAELALACDFRVCSPDAFWSFPEVHLGIFPGAGAPERLPLLIGPGLARQLLFTGRKMEAQEALSSGLVQAVSEDPLVTAIGWAERVARAAPLAVRALKRALDESAEVGERRAIIWRHRQPLDATSDYSEALAAFSEGRTPRFEGR